MMLCFTMLDAVAPLPLNSSVAAGIIHEMNETYDMEHFTVILTCNNTPYYTFHATNTM